MTQPCYEDVEPGDIIGPMVKQPSRQETYAFAALSRLSGRFVSDDGARQEGWDAMLVSSWQSMGYLAQLLTSWMGGSGFLETFEVSFRRVVEPGDRLESSATVVDKEVRDGRHVVILDVFMENQRGERPLQATAEVILPSRQNAG